MFLAVEICDERFHTSRPTTRKVGLGSELPKHRFSAHSAPSRRISRLPSPAKQWRAVRPHSNRVSRVKKVTHSRQRPTLHRLSSKPASRISPRPPRHICRSLRKKKGMRSCFFHSESIAKLTQALADLINLFATNLIEER